MNLFLVVRCAGALCVTAALSAACGGNPNATPTSPGDPTPAAIITIGVAGVSPKQLEASLGTQVIFINNSTRPREMTSDPHPEHTDCTAINSVGFILPGQRKETANLVRARTCGYHDHGDPDNTALKGSIVVR